MCDCVSMINEKLASRKSNTKVKVPFTLNNDLSTGAARLEIVT